MCKCVRADASARAREKMAELVETQREEIATLMKTPLRAAETWCLVSNDWFKQWKKYVGFDSWDTCRTGDRSIYPGPVNNSSLFKVGDMLDIKEHLIDSLDYISVPVEGWDKLVSWYGLIDGQEPIARKVVKQGIFVKHCRLEVYLTKLKLCDDGNMDNIFTRRFSKADTIDTIEREIRKLFCIPDEKETRLWSKFMNNVFEPLNKPTRTILESGLFDGQVIVVEQKNEDGTWPRGPLTIKSSGPSTPSALTKSKMAEARISVDQNEFLCPVCLDLLKDPVTIPCGHSYCKICITGCWDQEDQMSAYRCPQCRQTFSPRPALAKNTMLAEVVDKLKKTKLPADCYAGAGDVQCDVCTGRKCKAVKSCLVCLNSYCQNHLEQHESLFNGKRHNLTAATGRLQEMICQKHDKLLEVFCRTDQTCICVLCMMDDHKNHDTVSAAAQRTEKQHQLKETQRLFQQRIQQRERNLLHLREAVESHKRSAQTAVEDSERTFTELIHSFKRSRSEATQQIRDQERAAVSPAEGRLEQLEQEINDLRRRDAELEQLSHTQDHVHFLQSFQSLSAPPESTDVNDNLFSSLSSFDGMRGSVHQLRNKLEDFCKEELKKISDRVTSSNIVPRTRDDFLQYSQKFTLDLNTVNKHLHLFEGNRVITGTDIEQSYPDHPDRFDEYQVLCGESVCGRCYWEIEWSGSVFSFVSISMSYKSISRKGRCNECVFGCNDQSWSLICTRSRYSFTHNNIKTVLPVKPISRRTGVYVDHSAGILSFYSVSGDTMSLIHTVQTTFTQPLYPGIGVYTGSSVKLCW